MAEEDNEAGAVADCHIHIVGAPAMFPFAAGRSYSVGPASVADYRRAVGGTPVRRAVVVQPSFYGTDNAALLAALAEFGEAGRGVAVVDPEAADDRLLAVLHEAGVRGLRLNIQSVQGEGDPLAPLGVLDRLLAGSGWHIQLFVGPEMHRALAAWQGRIRAPLVIDHFGLVRPERMETDLPGLSALVEGGASVKLSAAYRIADDPLDPSVIDLARRIFALAPERMLWGSDWPHTPPHDGRAKDAAAIMPYRAIDTAAHFRAVESWFPDAADRRRLLIDNPARLYGW